MRLPLLLLPALLAACSGAPIRGGDGSFAIKCTALDDCREQAAGVCPAGYYLLGEGMHPGGVFADALPGPVTWHDLVVACGAAPRGLVTADVSTCGRDLPMTGNRGPDAVFAAQNAANSRCRMRLESREENATRARRELELLRETRGVRCVEALLPRANRCADEGCDDVERRAVRAAVDACGR